MLKTLFYFITNLIHGYWNLISFHCDSSHALLLFGSSRISSQWKVNTPISNWVWMHWDWAFVLLAFFWEIWTFWAGLSAFIFKLVWALFFWFHYPFWVHLSECEYLWVVLSFIEGCWTLLSASESYLGTYCFCNHWVGLLTYIWNILANYQHSLCMWNILAVSYLSHIKTVKVS